MKCSLLGMKICPEKRQNPEERCFKEGKIYGVSSPQVCLVPGPPSTFIITSLGCSHRLIHLFKTQKGDEVKQLLHSDSYWDEYAKHFHDLEVSIIPPNIPFSDFCYYWLVLLLSISLYFKQSCFFMTVLTLSFKLKNRSKRKPENMTYSMIF